MTRNDVGVIVAGSIGSVKVTRTSVPTGTFTDWFAGTIAATRGGTRSGDFVRNVDESAADTGLPARSRIAVVSSIVKFVLSFSGATGANVTALSPSANPMTVGTGAPAISKRIDAAVTVARLTGSD